MNERRLGRSLIVSAIGFGCRGLAAGDPGEAATLIQAAVARGVTFFDTADSYENGANEALLGDLLAPIRHDVTIATKVGMLRDGTGRVSGVDARPEHIRAACEASLRRLRSEVIDLYLLHRVDPAVPIEESVMAMAGLVQAGKVRQIGLSEASPETIRRAHAIHPLAAVESEYSLWTREPEADVLPLLRDLGIGFVAAAPLGRGFLTGALRAPEDLPGTDPRRELPRFQPENFERNRALLAPVEDVARRLGYTPAQLALAFVLAQGSDVVPIPGARSVAHLDEDLAALEVVFAAADFSRIDRAMPRGAAAGARQRPSLMALLGR